jgi:hypothetical protein
LSDLTRVEIPADVQPAVKEPPAEYQEWDNERDDFLKEQYEFFKFMKSVPPPTTQQIDDDLKKPKIADPVDPPREPPKENNGDRRPDPDPDPEPFRSIVSGRGILARHSAGVAENLANAIGAIAAFSPLDAARSAETYIAVCHLYEEQCRVGAVDQPVFTVPHVNPLFESDVDPEGE